MHLLQKSKDFQNMSSNQEKAVLENMHEPESLFESVEEDVFISNEASNIERRSCGMILLDSVDCSR